MLKVIHRHIEAPNIMHKYMYKHDLRMIQERHRYCGTVTQKKKQIT